MITTPEGFLNEFVVYFNAMIADSDVPPIQRADCYIVWYNYTLGNAKALVSTTRPDHKYYEMTYNEKKNELYIDSYLKVNHACTNVFLK